MSTTQQAAAASTFLTPARVIPQLMWTMTLNDGQRVDDYDAAEELISALNATSFGGFNDWRLPTVEELFMQGDRSRFNPAADPEQFPDTKSGFYWSSTPVAEDPDDYAWGVYFGDGCTFIAVRGPRLRPRGALGVAGVPRSVTRPSIFPRIPIRSHSMSRTKSAAKAAASASVAVVNMPARTIPELLWTAATLCNGSAVSFAKAQAAVQDLNTAAFGGFTDWRLPTREELLSLVDLGRYRPAIDTSKFPDTKSGFYWSSTPDAESPVAYAWGVFFYDGHTVISRSDGGGFVRAVRSVSPASPGQ